MSTHGPSARLFRPRMWTAAGLSVLMVVVALLVFSPLHKHDANRPGYCSIGHVDKALVSGAESTVALAAPDASALAEPARDPLRAPWAEISVIPARGPPAPAPAQAGS